MHFIFIHYVKLSFAAKGISLQVFQKKADANQISLLLLFTAFVSVT